MNRFGNPNCWGAIALILLVNVVSAQDRFETPIRTITITSDGQRWKEVYTITNLDPTVKEGPGKLPLTFNIVSDLGQTSSPIKGDKPIQRTRNMQLEFTFLMKYKGFHLSGSDTRKGQLRFMATEKSAGQEVSFQYQSDMTIDPSPWLPAKKTELNIMCPDYRQYKLPLKKSGIIRVECKAGNGKVLYTYILTYNNTSFKVRVVKGGGTPFPLNYDIKNNSPSSDRLGQYVVLSLKE